jgi:hypothetical protein
VRETKLSLNAAEYGYILNVLLEKRNELIRNQESTELVNEVLLKVCEAKRRERDRYEAR